MGVSFGFIVLAKKTYYFWKKLGAVGLLVVVLILFFLFFFFTITIVCEWLQHLVLHLVRHLVAVFLNRLLSGGSSCLQPR